MLNLQQKHRPPPIDPINPLILLATIIIVGVSWRTMNLNEIRVRNGFETNALLRQIERNTE